MDKTVKMSGGPTARIAILAAFRDIILEGGYENCRVLDVVERSGVARSTFYEHFASRDDLLKDSLRLPFIVLAQLTQPACDVAQVACTVEHLAENRGLVASLVRDPGMETLIDVLAEVIEPGLGCAAGATNGRAVAGAQLAVLTRWLREQSPYSAADLAHELHSISLALVGRKSANKVGS